MKESDEIWFDSLFGEHQPHMVSIANGNLGDKETAKDIAQDAFCLLWKKRDAVRSHPNAKGWLYLTLGNLIKNERKSARRRLERPLSGIEAIQGGDPYQPPLSESLPNGLSAQEKELIVMIFEDELPCKAIAGRLGISDSACRTRAFRAKNKCRESYLKLFGPRNRAALCIHIGVGRQRRRLGQGPCAARAAETPGTGARETENTPRR